MHSTPLQCIAHSSALPQVAQDAGVCGQGHGTRIVNKLKVRRGTVRYYGCPLLWRCGISALAWRCGISALARHCIAPAVMSCALHGAWCMVHAVLSVLIELRSNKLTIRFIETETETELRRVCRHSVAHVAWCVLRGRRRDLSGSSARPVHPSRLLRVPAEYTFGSLLPCPSAPSSSGPPN